jgi:hypothetical protein
MPDMSSAATEPLTSRAIISAGFRRFLENLTRLGATVGRWCIELRVGPREPATAAHRASASSGPRATIPAVFRIILRNWRRRRWRATTGRVIDTRHLKEFLVRWSSTSSLVSRDEYLVEFTGTDGARKRVAIVEETIQLPLLRRLTVGQEVPIHVDRSETKAVIGLFEPKVARAEKRRRHKAQMAEDEARFRQKIDEA